MKKILTLLLFTIILGACSSQKNDSVSISAKVTLEEKSENSLIEARLYSYFNPDSIVAYSKADANGSLQIELPKEKEYYRLHISSPGYRHAELTLPNMKGIVGDTELEVELVKEKVSEQFQEAYIIGNFCDWNFRQIRKFNKDDNGYSVEIDFPGDSLEYQILFNTEKWAFFPQDAEGMSYDDKGSYIGKEFNKEGKYKISFQKDDLAFYSGAEVPLSTYEISSPTSYREYDKISSNFSYQKFNELLKYYRLFILRDNDDVIKFLPEAEIKAIGDKYGKMYEENAKLLDEMLASVKDPALRDILISTKIIQRIDIDKATYSDVKTDFEKLTTIPIEQGAVISFLFQTEEIQQNPDELLKMIEKKINSIEDKQAKAVVELNYLGELGQKFNHSGEYSEFLIERSKMLLMENTLPEAYREITEQMLASLSLKSGNEAPDFEFTDFDGKKHRLSDFRGKWVLLDFWATWCQPCVKEIPHLTKAYKKFGGDNIQFISVSHDRGIEEAREFAKKNGMNWLQTINLDGYCDASEKYNVQSIPAPFLIDPNGKIVPMNDFQLRSDNLELTLDKYLNSSGS